MANSCFLRNLPGLYFYYYEVREFFLSVVQTKNKNTKIVSVIFLTWYNLVILLQNYQNVWMSHYFEPLQMQNQPFCNLNHINLNSPLRLEKCKNITITVAASVNFALFSFSVPHYLYHRNSSVNRKSLSYLHLAMLNVPLSWNVFEYKL